MFVLILWSTKGSFITKSAQKDDIEKVREYVEGKMMKVGRTGIPEIDFYDENIEDSWDKFIPVYGNIEATTHPEDHIGICIIFPTNP
ncbi:hypothetical protein DMENIID0001_006750 [Sergentomyia squamirostris]